MPDLNPDWDELDEFHDWVISRIHPVAMMHMWAIYTATEPPIFEPITDTDIKGLIKELKTGILKKQT